MTRADESRPGRRCRPASPSRSLRSGRTCCPWRRRCAPTDACTKPRAIPDASAIRDRPVQRAVGPGPGPLIRKSPNTWPTPFVVSTRLQARMVSAPASRGSELTDVPVYVAFVAWNVSPPVTEHVTWFRRETFCAAKVALAACTDVGLRAARYAGGRERRGHDQPQQRESLPCHRSLLVAVVSGRSRNKA